MLLATPFLFKMHILITRCSTGMQVWVTVVITDTKSLSSRSLQKGRSPDQLTRSPTFDDIVHILGRSFTGHEHWRPSRWRERYPPLPPEKVAFQCGNSLPPTSDFPGVGDRKEGDK